MNTDPGTATGTTAGSTTAGSTAAGSSTIDDADVARFSAMAAEWWDPNGKFRPLHKFNPVRLAYIRDCAAAHFARNATLPLPFSGLKLLDIGCGGGLVCEPMARLGFAVVGADASDKTVMTAATHARAQGLAIDYRATTAEVLAVSGERFDIILNLEVIEHVADVPLFLKSCAAMLRPGGLMIVATLNRTLKAWALAVVGAEYVLGWLPRGTHDWNKFITPAEMKAYAASAGLAVNSLTGVTYSPFSDKWSLSSDVDVNYMAEITLVTALSPAKPEAVT